MVFHVKVKIQQSAHLESSSRASKSEFSSNCLRVVPSSLPTLPRWLV